MHESRNQSPDTIRDFGHQWQIHGRVDEDYWTDVSLLKDYVGPLLDLEALGDAHVAEVGSGSGRIIRMLAECGPAELHAIEPSEGIDVLRENTRDIPNLHIHHVAGDGFRVGGLDFVLSLGVIQFIRDPLPTLKNIRDNLAEGGRFVIWVYGRENNGAYLALFRSIHWVTRSLGDNALDRLCGFLNYLLVPYVFLCRYLPLPMRRYILEVFGRCGMEKRKYILFDQLNPTYVCYYTEAELIDMLRVAGFRDIATYHRHGYSWTAVGRR
jgi:SAM-dependent methyltransferase